MSIKTVKRLCAAPLPTPNSEIWWIDLKVNRGVVGADQEFILILHGDIDFIALSIFSRRPIHSLHSEVCILWFLTVLITIMISILQENSILIPKVKQILKQHHSGMANLGTPIQSMPLCETAFISWSAHPTILVCKLHRESEWAAKSGKVD